MQQPGTLQQPGALEQPEAIQQPGTLEQPETDSQPGTVQLPEVDQPGTVQQPDMMQTPGAVQSPDAAQGTGNLVEVAQSAGAFNTLVTAVQSAGLTDTLANEGPFTVFAPTDEAFAALPTDVMNALMMPENQDLLTQILAYHVVPGAVTADELTTGEVETLNGGLAVEVTPDQVIVNDASVVAANVPASNGVIHVINRVLIPEGLEEEIQSRMASASDSEPASGL